MRETVRDCTVVFVMVCMTVCECVCVQACEWYLPSLGVRSLPFPSRGSGLPLAKNFWVTSVRAFLKTQPGWLGAGEAG